MSVSTRPAKPRTNTPAHPFPTGAGTTQRPRNGAPSEFANDPFVRRLADPKQSERDRQSRRDIIEGLRVLEAQRERATVADEYYNGDVGMLYASTQVRKLLAKQGMSNTEIEDFNYAKIPVNRLAERLQIAAVKVAPVVEEDDEEDGEASADKAALKRAERAVKMLRHNNRLDVYEKALHKDVSLHGEAYLFLWPVTDDSGKVVSVDFRTNTAHTVAFVYDPEDPLRVAYVIKSWETPSDFGEDGLTAEARKPVIRTNLYYPGPQQIDSQGQITQGAGRVERWVTEPGAPPNKVDSWKRVHDAEDIADMEEVEADEFGGPGEPYNKDDIPSPFGLTWFHFRNDVPCGRPEHESAYGPQALINKLVWMYAGVIEYIGFPQRYIMVDPKIDDPLLNDVDPDHPEDEDDDPENETGSSGLRSDPAAVWRLYGKSTGQYSAADPDTFMRPLDRFIKSMAELCGLPIYAFTKASADMPSGESLREMNSDELDRVRDRQARYDPEWQDAYELALRMLGIEGVAVDVRWVPAAAVNDLNGLQVLKAKGELGVPSEVLLNEAGYPDDQIDAWLKSQKGLSIEQRITLLSEIATAITGISPGVTAGIVPDNMTQALIARLFGNLAEGTADAPPGPDALPAPTFRDPPPTLPPGGMLGAGGPGGPGAAAKRTPAKKATPGAQGGGRTRAAGPGGAAAKKTAPATKRPAKAAAPVQRAGNTAQGGSR